MGLYDDLKALEPLVISTHWDADGVYSAVLLKRIFKVKEIRVPKVFGDYGFEFDKFKKDNPQSKLTIADSNVACDLGFPLNPAYDKIVIDHHPDHPVDRKYGLYWSGCPTGLVIYNNLKEHIKKEDTWLVLGSLVGDGQAELCPNEIWEANPTLLNSKGSAYKGLGFKISVSDYPAYVTLSSGVNALCRLGFPEQAIATVDCFNDPLELMESTEIRDASDTMRKEEDVVFKNKVVLESLGNWISLVRIRTSKPEVKIGGIIGAKLSNCNDKLTYIVLNESSGDISIRGTFAKYVCGKLNEFGYKAGGHAGFAGSQIEVAKIPQFIKDARKIRL